MQSEHPPKSGSSEHARKRIMIAGGVRMRKFILGLIAGGIAAYLWRHRQLSRTPHPTTPTPGVPEPDSANPRIAGPVPETSESQQVLEFRHADRAPSYQTAPLVDYRSEYQTIAEDLFNKTVALVGSRPSEKHEGSYRFLAKGGSTAAKIIIYERHQGRENGVFPMLPEGVYLLLRAQRSAPNTLGVTPQHEERFHYRRVHSADLDAAAEEIADVLQIG